MDRTTKICPLFFASVVSDIELECRPDRCAWAFDGGCAITAIAQSLDRLNESGIVVFPDDGA